MLLRSKVLTLLLILSNLLYADISVSFDKFKFNGVLKPFWNAQPVTTDSINRGIKMGVVPAYLQKTSFPYKNNFNKGFLFADKLTVVRLLGGLNPKKIPKNMRPSQNMDLAYRDKNGQVQYRWNLLEQRLSPFVEAGYKELTIVLDNTPWVFTSNPKVGPYGQISPPDDMKEWKLFLESLCNKLVELYGFDLVNIWRFRLGTEYQGTKRFNGNQKQYFLMYINAVDAIKKVLPKAKVGFFNQAHGIENTQNNNIDYIDILKQSIREKKTIDFVSISSYLVPNKKEKNFVMQLQKKAKKQNKFFKEVLSVLPKSSKIPIEVHEFGVIKNNNGVLVNAPGVYGTLFRFFMMFDYYKDPITQIYHWNVLDTLKKGAHGNYLLKGEGWLYSILDYAVNGTLFIAQDIYLDKKTVVKTLLIEKSDKLFVMVGALTDRNEKQNIDVNILLPNGLSKQLDFSKVFEVSYSEKSAIHNIIKEDLKEDGILKKSLNNSKLTSTIKNMGGKKAVKYTLKKWKRYEKVMVESLTLKKSSRLSLNTSKRIELNISTSELTVFVIDKK